MDYLRDVLVDRVAHPVGSGANQRVRARIEAQFHSLGYETSVQRRFACNAAATCATVENILATRRGESRRDGLVLAVAHYDSVGAGPGVSDDGLGVATLLEVARATRKEVFRNPVAFLVTDGEEAGLLGAEASVATADAPKVAVAINVEMRGTHGASNLFETSQGNRWLIRHLAGALEQPQASSLFYTIYNLLPNDTDMTVFKRSGIAALNFAAIRGVHRYHTPLDDFSNASPRTLQHHGDNVLASVRTLANADLDARSNSDATYFDVLGFTLVWWPAAWTLWIAIGSLVLLLVGVRKLPPRCMTIGVLMTFATVLLALAGGTGLVRIATLNADGLNFLAGPLPLIASMWLWGMAAAFAAAALFRSRNDPAPVIYGAAIVWHAIAIALALTLPGAAFLFLVPAMAATVCALAKAPEEIIAAATSTSAAVLFFPVLIVLYDALGSRLIVVAALVVALLATFVAPLFAKRWTVITLALLAVGCAIAAMLQPSSTPARPRPIALAWIDDAAFEDPVWATTALTPALADVARFQRSTRMPWSGGTTWTAPAPPLRLPRVVISGSRSGDRITVRVRSARTADRLTLLVRGGRVEAVNGVQPPARPGRFRSRLARGWSSAVVHGAPEMTVSVIANGSIEVVASDLTFGLPREGQQLARVRDASNATTIHDGDVTITRSRARF